MPSENKFLKKPQPTPASKQAAHQTKNPASSSTSPESSLSTAKINPSALTPAAVLQLQRTIGNQAVLRMLAQRDNSIQREVAVHETSAPTIQRIYKYKTFIKTLKKFKVDPAVLTADPGERALKAAKGKVVTGMFERGANIQTAYMNYEAAPSTETLIKLFNTITYWEALNHVSREESWYKEMQYPLEALKRQIKSEIEDATKSQHSKTELAAVDQETTLRNDQDQHWRVIMKPFMRTVGIAPRYFGKHLKDYPERVRSLEQFYDALQRGELKQAMDAYQPISAVPGMYLIKSLVIAHFAGNAELGSLVGTVGTGTGKLTRAEREAINTYSGGEYIAMNDQLRTTLTPPAAIPDSPIDMDQFDSFLTAVEDRANKPQKDQARKSVMELAVAGMNKLPPFRGIAYRGLLWQPGGYFDVIQPGAMVVDLAFQSASPSFTGVQEFMASQTGTKHIYFIIHTKSAVNIMAFAKSAAEGEVLFKPGAKFQVRAVWQHVAGKVPPNAPAEAQMILHSQGEFKSGGAQDAEGKLLGTNLSTGLTEKEVNKVAPAHRESLQWHQVKVIEMVEV